MEIEVFKYDFVDTSKTKRVYVSVGGRVFEKKEDADSHSNICMAVVLYHLGNASSFTKEGEFLQESLDIIGFEHIALLLKADLLVSVHQIQKRYAQATRDDFDRVTQIMGEIV
jgi:hypothetical protein